MIFFVCLVFLYVFIIVFSVCELGVYLKFFIFVKIWIMFIIFFVFLYRLIRVLKFDDVGIIFNFFIV